MMTEWVNSDKLCRKAGRFLKRREHDRLCTHTENWLCAYNALAEESLVDGTYLYKITPKFHAATHVYDVPTNPRAVHCYADEDMVGRMKKIYNGCHGLSASKRSIQRYAMVVCLRWWAAMHELMNVPYTF